VGNTQQLCFFFVPPPIISVLSPVSNKLRQAGENGEAELIPAVVIQACQLLCFPFALDVDEDTIALVIEAVRDSQIPPQLLQVPFYPPFIFPSIFWRQFPTSQPMLTLPFVPMWGQHLSAIQPSVQGQCPQHCCISFLLRSAVTICLSQTLSSP